MSGWSTADSRSSIRSGTCQGRPEFRNLASLHISHLGVPPPPKISSAAYMAMFGIGVSSGAGVCVYAPAASNAGSKGDGFRYTAHQVKGVDEVSLDAAGREPTEEVECGIERHAAHLTTPSQASGVLFFLPPKPFRPRRCAFLRNRVALQKSSRFTEFSWRADLIGGRC